MIYKNYINYEVDDDDDDKGEDCTGDDHELFGVED